MEDNALDRAEAFLESATRIAAQIRLGGTTGLSMLPNHAYPPIFNLGLDMARKGAARADIVEVIEILMASSGGSFAHDNINRFSLAALLLVLDGEGPDALREEREAAILGRSRLPGRDRRPPVFEVSPDGIESRLNWIDTRVSSRQDLLIKGNVSDELSVDSSGSFRVVGQVYAAHIEAEGSIKVEGCVFGKGRAVIRCGGDFHAISLERARLESGGDVHLGATVEPIELTCTGDLIFEGGPGVILGGSVRAGGSVHAGMIGGPPCTCTSVSTGAGITVNGTIHERTEISVGQSRMSLRQALTCVRIREEGFLLRLEAADAF